MFFQKRNLIEETVNNSKVKIKKAKIFGEIANYLSLSVSKSLSQFYFSFAVTQIFAILKGIPFFAAFFCVRQSIAQINSPLKLFPTMNDAEGKLQNNYE